MKSKNIALSLLAVAAMILSSCRVDKEIELPRIGENEVAFRIGAVQTRSASEATPKGTFMVASLTTDNGETFYLEDSVESLDQGLSTRGTPAFTENVQKLYSNFYAVANPGTSNALPDASFSFDGTTFWTHGYGQDIWAKAPLTFYLRMPGETGVTDLAYSDGKIDFEYTSPASAADQKDILFTSTTMESSKDNGKEVVFYHVLTGVKFANYFSNEARSEGKKTTKTIIKSVTINGLKTKGHCTVTPGSTAVGSSAEVSIWKDVTEKGSFTLSLDDNIQQSQRDATFAEYDSEYKLDELLNENASKKNLNDKDGSLTFWFIPQDLTKVENQDSVTITVKFDVELEGKKTFTDKELTVTLSDKLTSDHLKWKAGQLHTFTLRPTAVGVDIDDKMSADSLVKTNVVVENTGNVYEYVRVNIIGNWMGLVCESSESADENAALTYPEDKASNYVILMGYPNNERDDNGDYKAKLMVNPWNDKDFYSNGNYRAVDAVDIFMSPYTGYGTFIDLPCMADDTGDGGKEGNWIRHDKYYYYILPIGPGDSVTESLFKSYTVGESPAFWIADKWGTRRPAKNVHLEMDLAVQSIEAPMNADGTPAKTYREAWSAALNPNNDPDFNINDL